MEAREIICKWKRYLVFIAEIVRDRIGNIIVHDLSGGYGFHHKCDRVSLSVFPRSIDDIDILMRAKSHIGE